jgi:hypothetical protein
VKVSGYKNSLQQLFGLAQNNHPSDIKAEMLLVVTTGGNLDEIGDRVGDGGAEVAGYVAFVQRQDVGQIIDINRGVKASVSSVVNRN